MHAVAVLEAVIARVTSRPELVKAMVDEAPVPLVAFDGRRQIVAVNELAERFFRAERHQLEAANLNTLLPARFRQADPPPPAATPELTNVELTALRADGSEVMTTWTYGAAPAPDGPLFVMLVRERDQVLAELETTTYGVLFEQSPFPLALTKLPEGTTVAVNQAFADLFELAREEVLGRPSVAMGIATPAEREEVARLLAERGALRDYECARHTASGRRVELSLNVTRVRIGGVDHMLATVQDISKRKAQEAALARAMVEEKAARAESEAANRAKDEFLATMSHELRTPLNAILGWVTLLRPKPREPREEALLDRGLEVIERNARAQERLVSELLDMSRIISGKMMLNVTRTSLWEIVNAAADVVRPAAEAKGVRLLVDINPDLPSVIGDSARLQQVLWNLLSNAVRFTPRGGRVTITGERAGSGIQVRVQDSGQGIDAAHLASIFERFRQVDSSTTRGHGGLGLGLAIVRHLVEAHGGHVEAHSDGLGHGATFVVNLPVHAVDTTSLPALSRAPETEIEDAPINLPASAIASHADLAGVRVLVVDDQRDSLDILRALLEAAGAVVTAAESAQDALAESGPFDVIVSDIGMPDMDGYAMLEQIRARPVGGDVPAIALTAYVGRDHVTRSRQVGFQEHVSKPIDVTHLLETVARWGGSPNVGDRAARTRVTKDATSARRRDTGRP